MTETDEIAGGERQAANDNAFAFGRPRVRALRRRPGTRYALSDNLILPLAFAEHHPAWPHTTAALRLRTSPTVGAADGAPSGPGSSRDGAPDPPADSRRSPLDGTSAIRQVSPASET